MNISAAEAEPLAATVVVVDDTLTVKLQDGRVVGVPISWYPRLLHGTERERSNWRIMGGGIGIEWPDLDEHLSVSGLLNGKKSAETRRSVERWLAKREPRSEAGPRPADRVRNLALMPCVLLNRRLSIAQFDLHPYHKRHPRLELRLLRDTIEGLWSAAACGRDECDSGIVLRISSKGYKDALTKAEISALYSFSEIIAFCGLAVRAPFADLDYTRDDFNVILDYEDPRLLPTRYSALRDLYSVRERSQDHPLAVDVPLLRALIGSQGSHDWDVYYKAIAAFNCANTVRLHVPAQTAAVLLFSAFESLLNLQSFASAQLVAVFTGALSALNVPRRGKETRNRTGVASEWIVDFARLRDHFLHGRFSELSHFVWRPEDHMQLAIYAFPILLKLRLAEERRYRLTHSDSEKLENFERFAEDRRAA